MSFFSRIPKTTSTTYYLDPQFTTLCCRKLEFDASITKYRMTFYEYVELVQDLRIRGSPHITYAKFGRLAKFSLFFFMIFLFVWYVINGMNKDPNNKTETPFYYVYIAVAYTLVLGFLYWFQGSQEKLAVKKMRAYLASANPLLFNNKQLHWEVHTAGKYLALHLNYSGRAQDAGLGAFNQTNIEMYFQKNNASIHNVNLDASSESIRQTIMSSYKYAY